MQISRASLHSDSDLNMKVTKRITDREKLFILHVVGILQLIWPSLLGVNFLSNIFYIYVTTTKGKKP